VFIVVATVWRTGGTAMPYLGDHSTNQVQALGDLVGLGHLCNLDCRMARYTKRSIGIFGLVFESFLAKSLALQKVIPNWYLYVPDLKTPKG
jgi:hypothetical protein